MKYPNHRATFVRFAAVAVVGLLFSSLLDSCSTATFSLPPDTSVTPPPTPAPTFYVNHQITPIDLRSTVEPGHSQAPSLGPNARVVVGWETMKNGVPGFVFYYSSALTKMNGYPSNDHFSYAVHVADSLPIDAVRLDTVSGVPAAFAVGHLFVTDDPAIHDSLYLTRTAFFQSKNVAASSLWSMIVLNIGSNSIPRNGARLDTCAAVGANRFSKVVSYYSISKSTLVILPALEDSNVPPRDPAFKMDDDTGGMNDWTKVTSWMW